MSLRPHLRPRTAGLFAAALLASLSAPRPGRAAVVLDAFAQGSTASSPSLDNTAFTVGTGSDRLMIIVVSMNGEVPVTSVSFRNISATRYFIQASNQPGALCRTEIWRLVDPPSGAGFVKVSLTSATEFGVGVISYSGVDQKTPTSTVTTATGGTSPIRVSVPAPDNRPVLAVACLGGTWAMRAGPDAVAGPNDAVVWDFTEKNVVGLGAQQTQQGGGTVSWNVTWPDTFAWVAAGVSITPVPPPPPPPDAGPDLAPDVGPDTRPPNDPMPPPLPDAGVDLPPPPPPPDAGEDAQIPEEDAGEIEPGPDADIVSDDADADIDPPPPGDGPVPVPGDPSGTTVRDVNLEVGCACRLGGHGRPGLLPALALGLLVVRRRRR
jgi:MYXO-CTERM domain-containing protein